MAAQNASETSQPRPSPELWNEVLARLRRCGGRTLRGWCREVGLDADRVRHVVQRGKTISPEVRRELADILRRLAETENQAAA